MKYLITGFLAVAVLFGATGVQAQDFQVVVNAASSLSEISKDDLSKIFQKRARKLPSGESVKPVDQSADAFVRDAFSQAVLGRSASQMESFWQQQIFSGKDVPPEKKDTDDDVLAFVADNPGAIGYVSAGTMVGGGVKVIKIAD